ncbi:MAG: hypothetical protein AABX64_00500 [Nanoarchaeota archaeon]
MQYLNKEAITPLMIAFLLISFAVAVGVVIMNLGSAEVEEKAECAIEIGLRFSEIDGKQQVCYDAGKKIFAFTVENGVNINVEGLVVNIIGTEKAETFELNEAKMGKAAVYLGRVPFDTVSSGEIRQVKISPKIIPYDQEEVCIEQAILVESVKAC